jgi:hypothetical protein
MYQLVNFKENLVSIKRLSDNSFIPVNPDNTDYQAYLKWLAEGNTPLPAENA